MKYHHPEFPADNINILLDYLATEETPSSRYVYRGQVREWQGPLIPSLYRQSLRGQGTFTSASDEYKHSLRHCGHRFMEVQPGSDIEKLIQDHSNDFPLAPKECETVLSLCQNGSFAHLLREHGLKDAVRRVLSSDKVEYVLKRLPFWQLLIDRIHRGLVRQIGFLDPFSYMLGMTLAQQYGFASELLDFTADLRVAAFFATRDSQSFVFEDPETLSRRIGSDIAVIYRLPSHEGNVRYERLDAYGFYTCPEQLHLKDLCKRFEDRSSPDMIQATVETLDQEDIPAFLAGSMLPYDYYIDRYWLKEQKMSVEERVDAFLEIYFFSLGVRHFALLWMPPGGFAESRLGRQEAVMVVPDELRIEYREEDDYQLQAIEDLRFRDGFEAFYFRHSRARPDLGPIDRDYLWSKEGDLFRELVLRILDPSAPAYGREHIDLPKRPELVSDGFV
jgi:hypothetical protein